MRVLSITLILLPVLAACPQPEIVDNVTYHQDVAPILAEHCLTCHAPDGMNPYVLFADAESAQTWSPAIAREVETGNMPPFHAEETDDCPNPWGFLHDPRLDPEEKDLIAAWASAGGPPGDPATAAPLPTPPTLDLADADASPHPRGKYTTSPFGELEDEFVCLTIDPGLTEQKWLEALQVLPDNLEVTHHVLVGVDDTGESATLADENGVYPCFGGFGVAARFIGGWIPSATPIVFPPHSAVRIPAGARIVLQMHYHLTSESQQDGTGIALRWANQTPVREADVGLIGNSSEQAEDGTGLQPGPSDDGAARFFIPAGAESHTETMVFDSFADLPRRQQVFLVANHMHYVGTDMRLWLERGDASPDGADACLLHTPDWDFEWQQFYNYDAASDAAPYIHPGDRMVMRCVYENTLENPGVARALSEAGLSAPVDVGLGNGSLDEMCIAVLGTVYDVPMTVAEQSHRGGLTLVSSSVEFDFEDVTCSGPSSVSIGEDGSLEGIAVCGLDVLGLLATIEVSFQGTVTDGAATGTLSLSAVSVAGGGTSTWVGTLVGDTLTIAVDAVGTFGGAAVTFAGSIAAQAE